MVTKLAAVPAAVLDASGADTAEITAALQHVKVELLRDASAIVSMALRPLPVSYTHLTLPTILLV